MDDQANILYQVAYSIEYLQPKVGQTYKVTVQDVLQGHCSLSLSNILNMQVHLKDLDPDRF